MQEHCWQLQVQQHVLAALVWQVLVLAGSVACSAVRLAALFMLDGGIVHPRFGCCV